MLSRSTLVAALVTAELAVGFAAVHTVTAHGGPPFGPPSPPSFGFSLPADAAEHAALDRRFVTGPAPHVVIDTTPVDVEIVAADGNDVRVVDHLEHWGLIVGSATKVSAERTRDGVRVVSDGPHGRAINLGFGTHVVRITVPPQSNVEVRGGGAVQVRGLRTALNVRTSGGRITVADQRGDLDLETASGRIILTDVSASRIRALTHDGRLIFTRVGAATIKAHTDDGRIIAAGLRVTDGTMTTHDGRISAAFDPHSDADVSATTGDGRVSGGPLRLGNARGRFTLTTDDGNVVLAQGETVPNG